MEPGPFLPIYAAFDSLTAQTLYSGIFDTGSSAALVSLFAADFAKWNGIKTVPLTAVIETFTFAVISPLLEATFAIDPSSRPNFSASEGEIQICSIRTAHTFVSGILATGSIAGLVSTLVGLSAK